MSSIIAARFQTFDRAEGAVLALTDANVERADVAIANDSANAEPDAIESANDVVTGAALGGAIGLAVGIAVPVVGAAVTATAVGVGATRVRLPAASVTLAKKVSERRHLGAPVFWSLSV
jgi:uncharacterized membrane protein